MILRGKVETIGDLIELPLHSEGTYVAGTQLATCSGWTAIPSVLVDNGEHRTCGHQLEVLRLRTAL